MSTMACIGCGQTIPIAGEVCPFCHRDKSAQRLKALQAESDIEAGCVVLVVFSVVGAWIGGWTGLWVGAGIWIVLWVLSAIWGSKLEMLHVEIPSTPPSAVVELVREDSQRHRTRSSERSCSSSGQMDVVNRLRLIRQLHAEGLLSDDEYVGKRQALLAEL